MRKPNRRARRIVEPDEDSPLSAAVAERDRETIVMVEQALKRRDAMLAFQPVMQPGRSTRPAFYEGLIRILDDTGRIIPARDFMGAVEPTETGRIIDCLSLEMGIQALATDPSLRLSVNMSARSAAYGPWRRTLRRGLRTCPTAAERLILEITEDSAMLIPEIVAAFMADLQRQGVSFALDDFGAGMTSFRFLRQFYFDFVKIDGQFIRGIADSTDNQCVTQALVATAQQFDMFVVAESVETQREVDTLSAIGVDAMQGYYFGAPTVTPPWNMPAATKYA
jgi:EAL domain-containing protein (putative c-di-GMP-specific phosphodiesterase class I)